MGELQNRIKEAQNDGSWGDEYFSDKVLKWVEEMKKEFPLFIEVGALNEKKTTYQTVISEFNKWFMKWLK